MATLSFDRDAAHKLFAVECFNGVWDLIDKTDRTSGDNEQMLLQAMASLWHWTQRPDRTDKNLSISYWQVSRVYALLDDGSAAKHFAQLSLAKSKNESPFYKGYAYEALARAGMTQGDRTAMETALTEARRLASEVTETGDRTALEQDLQTVG